MQIIRGHYIPHGNLETPSVPDPNVFWPPGSRSISQSYGSGSGSFYHPSIIKQKYYLRKALILNVL
jgi:hypothetical protein